jgi:hypothetical protein
MSDPTPLVLLVMIGGDLASHGRTILAERVREGLGGDAQVLVQERDTAPSDVEARSLAVRLNASAVAEVSWSEKDDRARAQIHVFVASDESFFDRELSFAPLDAPEERERTVGLLLGAMVRAARATDELFSPTPPEESLSAQPTPGAEVERPASPPPREAAPRRFAVSAGATNALAVGGQGSGLGPSLGAGFVATPSIAVGMSGAARFGSIESANADTLMLRFAAGPLLRVVGRPGRDALALYVGVEALAMNEAVKRASPSARRDRWLFGSDASVSLGWPLTTRMEPYLSAGLETVFGTTPIRVDGRTLASLSSVRVLTDLGLRVRF